MQKIGFFNYRISAIVVLLLAMQSMLLAYSATLHSPTYLEPAFLASGIAHWEFGRFEPYRVNPPLVRMVAAIPVFAAGYQADWGHFYEVPGARSEFPLGDAFLRANGKRIVPLIIYARWACIPFSLLGAFFAYRWARELYGATAGLLALILFVFEPNLLAHGELITPDAACTGCGILAGYTFWRWLKCPTWIRACVAGGSMGLAELSKTSWLILFGVWWVLWFVWRCLDSKKLARIGPIDDRAVDRQADRVKDQCLEHHGELENLRPPALQLIAIQFLALYVVNLGYGFDGTGTLLRDFSFVSRTLTGLDKSGQPGNRFRDSVLGRIPLPVPKQYVLGIDSQKKDFEGFSHRSYLRGEWSEHGWWYYYIYGLLVKVPCGIWGLFAITIGCRVLQKNRPAPLRDELVLLVPAIALLALVSSQSEFSIHLRYAFPTVGLMLIFLGQTGLYLKRSMPFRATAVAAAVMYTVISTLLAYPNHLAYFNDFVGGPRNGHKHLLGSSLDWGQGTGEAIDWIQKHEPDSKVEISMWSQALATLLLNRPLDSTKSNSTDRAKSKLILYSADNFYGRRSTAVSNENSPQEEIIKQFESGNVLIRVQ